MVHLHPVWRERADFILGARIPDVGDGQSYWEQLWGRRVSGNRYELCCIPFFLYDLALSDVVETGSEPRSGHEHMLQRFTGRSGRRTYRVWFGDAPQHPPRLDVVAEVERLGCLWKPSSANLVAIDVATDAQEQAVEHALHRHFARGELIYERAWTTSRQWRQARLLLGGE